MIGGPRHTWPDLRVRRRARARVAMLAQAFAIERQLEAAAVAARTNHEDVRASSRAAFVEHIKKCEPCRNGIMVAARDVKAIDHLQARELLLAAGIAIAS